MTSNSQPQKDHPVVANVQATLIREFSGFLGYDVPPDVHAAVIARLYARYGSAKLPILITSLQGVDVLLHGDEALHRALEAQDETVAAGRFDIDLVRRELADELRRAAMTGDILPRAWATSTLQNVLSDLGEPCEQTDLQQLLRRKKTAVSNSLTLAQTVPRSIADAACDAAVLPRGMFDCLSREVWTEVIRGAPGVTTEEMLEELASALKQRRNPKRAVVAMTQGEAVVELNVKPDRVCILIAPDRLTPEERAHVVDALEQALARVGAPSRTCPVMSRVRRVWAWLSLGAIRIRQALPLEVARGRP